MNDPISYEIQRKILKLAHVENDQHDQEIVDVLRMVANELEAIKEALQSHPHFDDILPSHPVIPSTKRPRKTKKFTRVYR